MSEANDFYFGLSGSKEKSRVRETGISPLKILTFIH